MFMYADDSTLYTSATTVTEMTPTLNKELQLVSNHSLKLKPQLNLVINNVEIEQVEMTKLLGVILHCKRSLSNILIQQ